MPISIHTAKFALASEVFDNYNNVREAFSEQATTSFGDANRTLIDKASFRNQIKNIACDAANFSEHRAAVLARIDSLPEDVYIDLEN